jgi:hypothetical protein
MVRKPVGAREVSIPFGTKDWEFIYHIEINQILWQQNVS